MYKTQLKLRYFPDPILTQKCESVTNFDIRPLVDEMFKMMYKNKAVGIAAPQVGIPISLFLVNLTKKRVQGMVFINTKIIETSGTQWGMEGCLSFPKKFIQKIRPNYVKLEAQDLSGSKFEIEARDLLARVILHEYDHTQGKLFNS